MNRADRRAGKVTVVKPKMRVLVATPCYGGVVTVRYLASLLTLIDKAREIDIYIQPYFLETESLIPRGRNTCAKYAIDNHFDKLFFIDADMIWTWESAKALLLSDKKIIGGTYPLKSYPITLNFNPIPPCPEFRESRQLDNYIEFCKKYADEKGEAEVAHLPTGFMLIDLEVLAKLSHTVGHYVDYHPDSKKTTWSYNFFPIPVIDEQLQSEDWAFCHLAREAGFKIYLQTRAVNGHTGIMHYTLGQHEIVTGQPPLIP